MNTRSRIIAVGLILTGFFSLAVAGGAFAQSALSLSDAQLQQIRTNCTLLKPTIDQLHTSDTLLRVNRGQLYETLSIRLINNFNGRVVSNGRNVQGLLTITNTYQAALSAFRLDYSAYERQLTALSRIDCEQEPGAFYEALVDARQKRAAVNSRVRQLNAAITDYRAAVKVVKAELPREVSQ